MHTLRNILHTLVAVALVGCGQAAVDTKQAIPANYVEVGTVTAHGVWATKKALAQAGIPAYTDGSPYPHYRILVPPAYREQAVTVLERIDRQPGSVGYGITHE